MADAQDKARLARVLKGAEILVQLVAAHRALARLAAAALYGAVRPWRHRGAVRPGQIRHSARSPAKPGALAGNALVEAATFVAICSG